LHRWPSRLTLSSVRTNHLLLRLLHSLALGRLRPSRVLFNQRLTLRWLRTGRALLHHRLTPGDLRATRLLLHHCLLTVNA
jgi:hypothetical protein